MSRFDTAYLELEDAQGEGVFELNIGLQTQGELDKSFLMGERGQYVTEIINQLDILGEVDSTLDRRAGFWIDGGAGNYSETIQFETGLEDVRWGDGVSDPGPNNVTPRDASGANVKPLTRYQVMALWLARSRTDSANPARLYFGEYATGKHHAEAGAFNQAMPVAVVNFQPELAEPDNDGPGQFRGTIGVSLLTPFADYDPPDWLTSSNIGSITDHFAQELSDHKNE